MIRNKDASVPSRPITVIYDHYDVSSDDNGDVFTVLSYDKDRFTNDVPMTNSGIRASDTLDFRPRVLPFTATNKSPFEFSVEILELIQELY